MVKPSEVSHLRAIGEGEVSALDVLLSPQQLLGKKWRSKIYSGGEILSEIKPREWFIPSWLPRDGAISIYGPSGVGKSFYALAMSLELARGGNFLSHKVDPCSVLYVAAERATDQRDRVEAWQLHHNREAPKNFHLLAASPQLTNALEVDELISIIREQGARVVVLDTFARMTLGMDENTSQQMGLVMDALDRLREATDGGVVIVVHHTGKDAAKGARGSTAFLGALDVGILLSGNAQDIRAKVDKSNAGPDGMVEHYKIQEVALPPLGSPTDAARVGGVIVGTYAKDSAGGLDELVLEVLEGTGIDGLTARQLLEALEEEGHPSSQASLSKAITRLEAAKRISRSSAKRPQYYFEG